MYMYAWIRGWASSKSVAEVYILDPSYKVMTSGKPNALAQVKLLRHAFKLARCAELLAAKLVQLIFTDMLCECVLLAHAVNHLDCESVDCILGE